MKRRALAVAVLLASSVGHAQDVQDAPPDTSEPLVDAGSQTAQQETDPQDPPQTIDLEEADTSPESPYEEPQFSSELSAGGTALEANELPFLFTIDVHFEGARADWNRCLATRIRPGPRLALMTAAHCLMNGANAHARISRIDVVRGRGGGTGSVRLGPEDARVLLPTSVCARRELAPNRIARPELMVCLKEVPPHDCTEEDMAEYVGNLLSRHSLPEDVAVIVARDVTADLRVEGFLSWSDAFGQSAIPVRAQSTDVRESVQSGQVEELRRGTEGMGFGFTCEGIRQAATHQCRERTRNDPGNIECHNDCIQTFHPHVGKRVVNTVTQFLADTTSAAPAPLRARRGDSGGPLVGFGTWPSAYSLHEITASTPTVIGVLSRVYVAQDEPHTIYTAGPTLERMQCVAWRYLEGESPSFCAVRPAEPSPLATRAGLNDPMILCER